MAKQVSLSEISDIHDFNKQVLSLPQELFNEIRDLTFTPDFETTRCIDDNYNPPSILQVDTTSRLRLQPVFYGNTVFTFPNDLAKFYCNSLSRWLQSLSHYQQQYLRSTELHIFTDLHIGNYGLVEEQIDSASNVMDVTGQSRVKLEEMAAEVYVMLAGLDSPSWRAIMMKSVKFVCRTDDEGQVVVDWFLRFKVYKGVQAELGWAA